jgi:hypothetical protein
LSTVDAADLRVGIRAGAIAGVLGGAPSTVYALATRRPLLDTVRAAGTLLVRGETSPTVRTVAGVAAHAVISLGWGVVLSATLPRRRTARWGALAGLAIAGLDLGVLGRRWPRIRALPVLPQVADHVAYGALVGVVLSRSARRR